MNVAKSRFKEYFANQNKLAEFDPKQGISGLGFHTKAYVCYFLNPFDLARLGRTSKVWNSFLKKNQNVWEFVLKHISLGKVTLEGEVDSKLVECYKASKFFDEFNNLNFNKITDFREFFYKKVTDRYRLIKLAQI